MRHARIPHERATEFAARLEELALEFSRLPRDGDREYALIVGVFPTTRPVSPRREGPVVSTSTAPAKDRTRLGRELPQAVQRERDLEPRRRHRHGRLSVAGVGRHPQPPPDLARTGRRSAAVARVLTAGGRDHRPRRSPAVDGEHGRLPFRAGRRRRAGGARPTGLAARPGRRLRRRRDRVGALHRRRDRHPAARHGRGAAGQRGADDHAGDRPGGGARTGERTAVERRGRRQHVRRSPVRLTPAGSVVRPAVRRRCRHLPRRCGARRDDPRLVPGDPPGGRRAGALAGRAPRRRGLALAARAVAPDGDHPRGDERRQHDQLRHVRAVRPGGARGRSTPVHGPEHGRSGRRHRRRRLRLGDLAAGSAAARVSA